MARSSGGNSTSEEFNSTSKRGLSRFSLSRLFHISSNKHRTTVQSRPANFESVRRSERGSLEFAFSQAQPSNRDSNGFRTAGPSSSSSESSSICNVNVDSEETSQEGLENIKEYLECPLCILEQPRFSFPKLRSCDHRACYNCLQQYLKIAITESRVNISCPVCTEPIHPSDIYMILTDEILLEKYESFTLRRFLMTEPDVRWCPAPDCGYAVIARVYDSCPMLKCERPGCNTCFCYHCRQEWHPNQTCVAAQPQRAEDSTVQIADDIKACPRCKVLISKTEDTCHEMVCSVCGTKFCWLCMKEVTNSLHYFNIFECKYMVEKPWSRRKKMLLQLGMLVGAPVGIPLIASIAVPAIIIGIPAWVGKKLHKKYSQPATSRLKKNLIVTSGVVASAIVSPVLAGITVGIGVPILLTLVYGVAPVFLNVSGVTPSAPGDRVESVAEKNLLD